MRSALFLLLALAGATAVAAAAAPPKCDNSTLPTTLAGLEDPGQEPVAWVFAEGIRLYSCASGTPALQSGGVVVVTSGGPGTPDTAESVWTGTGVYPDASGNGTFVLVDSSDGSKFNLTLNYQDVLFVPSPDGALDWARWTVFTVPEKVAVDLGAGWGTRVDTTGGAPPKSCANADKKNNQVEVPYTAYYYLYPCPDDSMSGETTSPPAPPASAGVAASAGTLAAAVMATAAAALAF